MGVGVGFHWTFSVAAKKIILDWLLGCRETSKNRISVAGVSLSECLSPGRFFKNNVAGCDIVGTLHAKNRFAANSCLQRTAKKWPIGTFPMSNGKSETFFVWAKFKSSLVKWSGLGILIGNREDSALQLSYFQTGKIL